MIMILLKQVFDFFRDLIFSATIPLLLGSLTGIIISIVLFVFINKFLLSKVYLYIKIPFGVFLCLCMICGGAVIGCWTSVIFPVKKILNVTFTTAENVTAKKLDQLYALPKQKLDELMPNEKVGEVFDTVYKVSMESISEAKMPATIKNMVSEHINDDILIDTVGSSVKMVQNSISATIHNILVTTRKILYRLFLNVYQHVLLWLWIVMLATILLFIACEYLNFAFFAACKKLIKISKTKKLEQKEKQSKVEENADAKVIENIEEQKKEESEQTPPQIEFQPKDLVSEAVDRSWNAATTVDEVSTAELVDRHNRTTTQ